MATQTEQPTSSQLPRRPRPPKPDYVYAVKIGKEPGIYLTAKECEELTKGVKGGLFRKFLTREEAEKFLRDPLQLPTKNSSKTTTYYAVKVGRLPGIYDTSEKCHAQVSKYPKNVYQRVGSIWEGEAFVYGIYMGERTHYLDSETYWSATALVFVDGSCRSNGLPDAAAGIGIYWGYSHPYNVGEALRGRQSSNRAYIIAALRAIAKAKRESYRKIILCSNSAFLVNNMVDHIHHWEKNGWTKANGQPVVNGKDFARLLKANEGIDVRWVRMTTGGIGGLDGADWLAKQGARHCEELLAKESVHQLANKDATSGPAGNLSLNSG